MITAIIQARMSSARLKGKVLLPLGDLTVLERTVGRVRRARSIARVVVATSLSEADMPIVELCAQKNIDVFRGDLNDVLDRYYRAAQHFDVEHVCRITSDCPLIDPNIIDTVAAQYELRHCDYISTGRMTSTFPDGMDTEIFSFGALERAWKEATLPSDREHVTPYIWNHPDLFTIETVQCDEDLSAYRLTLDEPNDYLLLKNVVAHAPDLSMEGIIEYLKSHPDVAAINASIARNEGYARSLAQGDI